MEQLIYTSAPQGLRSGSTGFCTVEMTEGMSPDIMDSLESLSAYDNAPSGTINWMSLQLNTAIGMRYVLSRVGPIQGEFSGRTNKLAHHISLEAAELPPQGPTRIIGPGGPLQSSWSGQVRHLPPSSPTKMRGTSTPRVCQSWAQATGDAGVAGAVLARLRQAGSSPLWVIHSAAMDAFAMTDQMLALLPGQERWEITFSTYLHTLPQSAECRLRWVLADSPAMQNLRNMGSDQQIDLRKESGSILSGADQRFVKAARSGHAIVDGHRSTSRVAATHAPTTGGGVSRRDAIDKIDLNSAQYASRASATAEVLPPPPSAEPSSPLKWIAIGVALAIIPAGLLLAVVLNSDPAPVVAMREVERSKPVETKVEPKESVAEPSKKTQKPKAQTKPTPKKPKPKPKKVRPKPRVVKDTGPKSSVPKTVQLPIKLPSSALSLTLETQTLFQGPGVRTIKVKNLVPMRYKVDFTLTDPDHSGARDLIAVDPVSGREQTMASLFVEPDRVLFAWSPNTRSAIASAFLLAHEFVVQDNTHLTTIQMEFAKPVSLNRLPLPVRPTDVSLPLWFLPEYPCLLVAKFQHADGVAEIGPVVIADRPIRLEDVVWEKKRINTKSLDDRLIKHAEIGMRTYFKGDPLEIAFESNLRLKGLGTPFPWAQRKMHIEDETKRFNAKNANQDILLRSTDRKKLIEQWGRPLSCELELYVDIQGRKILWAKSAARPSGDKNE